MIRIATCTDVPPARRARPPFLRLTTQQVETSAWRREVLRAAAALTAALGWIGLLVVLAP